MTETNTNDNMDFSHSTINKDVIRERKGGVNVRCRKYEETPKTKDPSEGFIAKNNAGVVDELGRTIKSTQWLDESATRKFYKNRNQ